MSGRSRTRQNQSRHSDGGSSDAPSASEFPTIEHDANDPVFNAISYGMECVMKIVNDTVPHFLDEDESVKKDIENKMEESLLKLIEAELAYAQTNSIVTQVVSELNLDENPEDMEIKDFLAAIDKIDELSNSRLAEYKASLTPDLLRCHPVFLQKKVEFEALLNPRDNNMDSADADTELDEVDLEDSQLADQEDSDSYEVIPELDPISKQPLTDPVRNRVCKHVYGKSAMLQLLKKNPKTRCPAMGCGNNQFVKAIDLVEDPVLTARVQGSSAVASSSSSGTSSRSRSSTQTARRGRR